MKKVVFCGGCDITAICRYIKKTPNVKVIDYNLTNTWMNSVSHYWIQALDNKKLPNHEKYGIYYPDTNPLLDKDIDILVISILGEVGEGLYRNKKNGSLLLYGFANVDATKNPLFYTDGKPVKNGSVLESIINEFEFLGEINQDDVIKNYKRIISSLDPHIYLYILLGPTFESAFGEKNYYFQSINGIDKYSSLNKKMKSEFGCYKNVKFIDPAKFYSKPRKLKQLYYYGYPSIRHYSRFTYFKIASYISKKHISITTSTKEMIKLILGHVSK